MKKLCLMFYIFFAFFILIKSTDLEEFDVSINFLNEAFHSDIPLWYSIEDFFGDDDYEDNDEYENYDDYEDNDKYENYDDYEDNDGLLRIGNYKRYLSKESHEEYNKVYNYFKSNINFEDSYIKYADEHYTLDEFKKWIKANEIYINSGEILVYVYNNEFYAYDIISTYDLEKYIQISNLKSFDIEYDGVRRSILSGYKMNTVYLSEKELYDLFTNTNLPLDLYTLDIEVYNKILEDAYNEESKEFGLTMYTDEDDNFITFFCFEVE